MSDGYGATTEQMHRAAGYVDTVNAAVQAELVMLRGRLAPLSGAWRGDAAAAFTGLMSRWDTDARLLNDALRGIGEALRGSGVGYQTQEHEHAGTLSAIRAALG